MYVNTKQGINKSLRVIGLAGFAGVAVIAPNALQALNLLLKKTGIDRSKQQRILAELKRQGLVHIRSSGGTVQFTITPAGAHRLQQANIDDIAIDMPKKWDRRWRLVTFDIPLNQSAQRQAFTSKLRGVGFMMLQKSLWVHPAPCFEQVEVIAGHYNVLRYCTLMEISSIDELSAKKLHSYFSSQLKT